MKKVWETRPQDEHLKTEAIGSAASFATIGLLACVFNPLAVAAGCVLGEWGHRKQQREMDAKAEKFYESCVRNGFALPMSSGVYQADREMVVEMARDLKLRRVPEFLIFTPEGYNRAFRPKPLPPAAEKTLQWIERILGIKVPRRDAPRFLPTHFATTHNLVYTTTEGLRNFTREERKFIYAHELAHIKTRDHHTFSRRIALMAGASTLALYTALGVVAAVAILAAPIAPPVTVALAGGIGTLVSVSGTFNLLAATAAIPLTYYVGGFIGSNLASRMREFRADRNAMAVTGSLRSAEMTFEKMQVLHGSKPADIQRMKADTPMQKILVTHPGYRDRMLGLRDSWRRIAAFCASPDAKMRGRPAPRPQAQYRPATAYAHSGPRRNVI